MIIQFITAEVALQATPIQLQQAIESELQKQGEPLRWAITSVDIERQKVLVEAIITVCVNQTSLLQA